MAEIQVKYADGRRFSVQLSKPEMVIGRDASCDIPLQDAITSRFHAKISRSHNGEFAIQDMNSKNGISVNDSPVTAQILRHGDLVGIGNCQITFFSEKQPVVVMHDTPTHATLGGTSAWRADPHVELSQRRLKTLYEMNERLTGRFDRDNLLKELLNVCVEQLRFERAGIALCHDKQKPIEWIHLVNLGRDPSGEFRISRSVVDRCVHHAERILINDTAADEVDPTQSMISNNILSAMCVPMEYLQDVHGVIYGDRITSSGGYMKEDIDFFAALGRLGAMGLANVQLVEEIKSRNQVEAQLKTAREIQANLFPAEPLRLDHVHIDALNDPGQKVSGDYYDFFVRPDGKIAIVIADVAGKGLPASLLMANLQAAVRIIMDEQTDMAKTAQQLNRLVCRNIGDSRFITGLFALLDPEKRTFECVNAGHLMPFRIQGRKDLERIEMEPTLPLGIDPEFDYQPVRFELPEPPCLILAYTDGVPDAEDDEGVQFGDQRLVQALTTNVAQASDEVVTRVRRSIKQFTRNHPLTDDITLLAIDIL